MIESQCWDIDTCEKESVNLEVINGVNYASLLFIIDEGMQRYINAHHVHIGSLLT